MKRLLLCVTLLLTTQLFLLAEEGKLNGDNFGTVHDAICNDDHVNARSYPSRAGKVLYQINHGTKLLIFSTSKEKETIEGYTAYWYDVTIEGKYNHAWVFGQFIDGLPKTEAIMPSVTRIYDEKQDDYTSHKIEISMLSDGQENKFSLDYYPTDFDRNSVLFVWMNDDANFSWHNVAGTFLYNKKTKILEHLSYIGQDGESAWIKISYDKKYLLEDFGTSPGPRIFFVWEIGTDKTIYSGVYYRDLALSKDNKVTEVVRYGDSFNDELDPASKSYAKKFIRTNPYKGPIEKDSIAVAVQYRVDFTTGKRNYIGCVYYTLQ